MGRCTRTTNLEIHHIRRDGGNGLDNAKVLCQKCHAATHSYGTPGKTSPDFSQDTKDKALRRAGNQCECTSISGCHWL
jgi:5-methylcytosine-specific restriction endonuclease McrA